MSRITFKELRDANIARDVEWGQGQNFGLSYRGNELAGETGEACNVLKKLDRERRGLVGSRATIDQAADELADVIICADLAAMDLGIDLAAAVARKFNKTTAKYGLLTKLPDASNDSLVLHVMETPPQCDHDWDNGGMNPESCLKCGMSFTRYIHTECP